MRSQRDLLVENIRVVRSQNKTMFWANLKVQGVQAKWQTKGDVMTRNSFDIVMWYGERCFMHTATKPISHQLTKLLPSIESMHIL